MTVGARMTATGFNERDFRAIKAFLVRSTVPLIYESGDTAGVQGSGCLFDFGGCLYFVTAGHVLERVDPDKLGVPLRTHGNEVFTLGPGVVGWSRTEAFDVAAYRIDDLPTAAALRDSYAVLGSANVAPREAESHRYIVVGYPSETVVKDGKELTPSDLTQIYTVRYDGEVIGLRGAHDVFLELDRQSKNLWGNAASVPKLPGISGGPVWQVRPSTTGIWTPESVLSLVGIQVSCDPLGERYMRVLRWEMVTAALLKLALPSTGTNGAA
jgi:hypothetical protein